MHSACDDLNLQQRRSMTVVFFPIPIKIAHRQPLQFVSGNFGLPSKPPSSSVMGDPHGSHVTECSVLSQPQVAPGIRPATGGAKIAGRERNGTSASNRVPKDLACTAFIATQQPVDGSSMECTIDA